MPDSFWIAVSAVLVTALTQAAGIIVGMLNLKKTTASQEKVEGAIQELHIQINSNQQKQIEDAVAAAVGKAMAAGLMQGRQEGHAEGLALGHATALSEERAPSVPVVEKEV